MREGRKIDGLVIKCVQIKEIGRDSLMCEIFLSVTIKKICTACPVPEKNNLVPEKRLISI